MNLPVFYEPVIDNVYLEDFYKNPARYGFPLQVCVCVCVLCMYCKCAVCVCVCVCVYYVCTVSVLCVCGAIKLVLYRSVCCLPFRCFC